MRLRHERIIAAPEYFANFWLKGGDGENGRDQLLRSALC